MSLIFAHEVDHRAPNCDMIYASLLFIVVGATGESIMAKDKNKKATDKNQPKKSTKEKQEAKKEKQKKKAGLAA